MEAVLPELLDKEKVSVLITRDKLEQIVKAAGNPTSHGFTLEELGAKKVRESRTSDIGLITIYSLCGHEPPIYLCRPELRASMVYLMCIKRECGAQLCFAGELVIQLGGYSGPMYGQPCHAIKSGLIAFYRLGSWQVGLNCAACGQPVAAIRLY